MNQVVGECLWSLHSASMSLQVVNRELMMSHLHRMTSYSRAQQMIDPAHPLILFIVQVCTCIIAHVHLCMLCMSMCAALCVLRCLCCAICAALCVLCCAAPVHDLTPYVCLQTLSRYTSEVEQLVHTVDKRYV